MSLKNKMADDLCEVSHCRKEYGIKHLNRKLCSEHWGLFCDGKELEYAK
jgi:hypothetical protein